MSAPGNFWAPVTGDWRFRRSEWPERIFRVSAARAPALPARLAEVCVIFAGGETLVVAATGASCIRRRGFRSFRKRYANQRVRCTPKMRQQNACGDPHARGDTPLCPSVCHLTQGVRSTGNFRNFRKRYANQSARARNNIARARPPATGNSCVPYRGREIDVSSTLRCCAIECWHCRQLMEMSEHDADPSKREVGSHTPQHCSVLSTANRAAERNHRPRASMLP